MPIIRTIRAYENETVEIQWTAADGTVSTVRYTIPPKPTREARAPLSVPHARSVLAGAAGCDDFGGDDR